MKHFLGPVCDIWPDTSSSTGYSDSTDSDTADLIDSTYSTDHSLYSSGQVIPCSYKGIPINSGDSLKVDGCTMLACIDDYVHADIQGCRYTMCDQPFIEPLPSEEQCCEICPYGK